MLHKRLVRMGMVGILAAIPAAADLNLWVTYHYAGVEAYEAGKYAEAETLLNRALEEIEDDGRLAFTYDVLGKDYIALGRYDDAMKALESALCLKEDAYGCESNTVPETLNTLGDLHYIADGPDVAEAKYREALALHEKNMYSIETCRALNGLALIHAARSEYVDAERLLQDALKRHQRGARRDHPYTATILTNLGILYTQLGRYDEAEPLLARAEYIHNKMLPAVHPDAALRLHAQAELLHRTNRADEARDARRHAEEIQTAIDGVNNHN